MSYKPGMEKPRFEVLGDLLNKKNSEDLVRCIIEVFKILGSEEKTAEWIRTKYPVFENLSPFALIIGEEKEKVFQFIEEQK